MALRARVQDNVQAIFLSFDRSYSTLDIRVPARASSPAESLFRAEQRLDTGFAAPVCLEA